MVIIFEVLESHVPKAIMPFDSGFLMEPLPSTLLCEVVGLVSRAIIVGESLSVISWCRSSSDLLA